MMILRFDGAAYVQVTGPDAVKAGDRVLIGDDARPALAIVQRDGFVFLDGRAGQVRCSATYEWTVEVSS